MSPYELRLFQVTALYAKLLHTVWRLHLIANQNLEVVNLQYIEDYFESEELDLNSVPTFPKQPELFNNQHSQKMMLKDIDNWIDSYNRKHKIPHVVPDVDNNPGFMRYSSVYDELVECAHLDGFHPSPTQLTTRTGLNANAKKAIAPVVALSARTVSVKKAPLVLGPALPCSFLQACLTEGPSFYAGPHPGATLGILTLVAAAAAPKAR